MGPGRSVRSRPADNGDGTLTVTAYTLSVAGVRDQRSTHNLIGANSTAFTSYILTPGVLAWDYYGGVSGTSVDDNLRADPQFPDGVITNSVLTSFTTMAIITGGDPGPFLCGAPGTYIRGWIMSSRRTHWSNCSAVISPSCTAASRSVIRS